MLFKVTKQTKEYLAELKEALGTAQRAEVIDILKRRIHDIESAISICSVQRYVDELIWNEKGLLGAELVFQNSYYGEIYRRNSFFHPLPLCGHAGSGEETFTFDFAPGVSRVIVS